MRNEFHRVLGASMLATVIVSASACGLRSFERPQSQTVSSTHLSTHDLIAYRMLDVGDFHAAAPPGVIAAHAQDFWAYSCLQLRPRNDAPLAIVATSTNPSRFRATPIGLHYSAYFDRDCSWWNPAGRAPPGYTLQHEQIHFLITELAARRLNARAAEIIRAATVEAATPEAAREAAQQVLRSVMQSAVRQVDAVHLAFDRDASKGAHIDQQQAWWMRLSAQLDNDDSNSK